MISHAEPYVFDSRFVLLSTSSRMFVIQQRSFRNKYKPEMLKFELQSSPHGRRPKGTKGKVTQHLRGWNPLCWALCLIQIHSHFILKAKLKAIFHRFFFCDRFFFENLWLIIKINFQFVWKNFVLHKFYGRLIKHRRRIKKSINAKREKSVKANQMTHQLMGLVTRPTNALSAPIANGKCCQV